MAVSYLLPNLSLELADRRFVALVEGPLPDPLRRDEAGPRERLQMRRRGGLRDAELVGDEDHAYTVLDEIPIPLGRKVINRIPQPLEYLQSAWTCKRLQYVHRCHGLQDIGMFLYVLTVEDWSGSSPSHAYYVCDVFTSTPLEGNQLGVFVDGQPFADDEMQRIARELNLAETVFLFPPEQGGDVRLRIFTPASELPFAGHPILGTSFVVGAALGKDDLTLEVEAGLVPVTLERPGFRRMRQTFDPGEPF